MNKAFETLKTSRKNLLALLEDLNLEQLNTQPAGFNNTLLWNAGHLLVTEQLLTYGLCRLPLNISDELLAAYRKGSKPEAPASAEEWHTIRRLLLELPDKTAADYTKGLFTDFTEYPTSFGLRLHSIEDALNFVNVHEGLHLGYCMAQKRALLSP